jgi:methylase of polypeptide subunit release factors
MARHPVADKGAAKTLGGALRRVGYSEAAVIGVLGDDASSSAREDAPIFERRLPQTRLATVIRAFFLQQRVPTNAAVDALGPRALEALEATALAEVGDEVIPRIRILPVGDLFVASDDFGEGDDPPDYVAAYTPTSQVCEALTPRTRIGRALDVGTGSGVQALLAARHARHVVATDVNVRALAYTELNAALNGLENIDCRRGSLFEPVEGETFDLITSNAPYVVSPETRWAYRDAGLEADQLSERVVREAAEHLDDGGFATLIVSWVAADEDAPDEHALAWTEGLGCDSWILPVWEADPLDHAATWNADLAGDTKAFSSALDEWTRYLAHLGVQWVNEGAILLHRRPGRCHTARVDAVEEDDLEEAGQQVRRAFEARARLAELGRAADLLEAKLALAAPLHVEHELRPGGRRPALLVDIQVAGGTNPTVEGTGRAAEAISSLDGRASLAQAVGDTAERLGLDEAETSRLRREALKLSRELLELGALRFRP